MTDISSQRKRVLAISEGTYGTDAVDAALQDASADLIYQDLTEVEVTPTRETVEIQRVRGVHSGTKHNTLADITSVNVTGAATGWQSSTSGEEEPYWAPFLKAANMEVSVTSGTSSVYVPVTTQQSGMSLYMFERELDTDDWRLTYTTGVLGTLTLNFALNSEVTWTFEGTGLYEAMRSDAAEFFDPSTGAIALLNDGSSAVTSRSGGTEAIANLNPLMCQSMSIQVNNNDWPISDLEFSLNWEVAIKRTVTGDTSGVRVYLTRAPSGARIGGSLTLIDGSTAHDAMIDDFVADTERELEVIAYEDGDASTSGSKRMTLLANQIQLGQPSAGDEAGILTHSVPFFCNGDFSSLTDGSDFSLTFDEVP